ncbi:MAG: hypothetical protein IJX14_10895, partial [Clostridia bacterium]|nr:hypothetical protein [Clostridia bacterium]
LESGGNVSGIGWKTQRFLQNTWDSLTECFLKTILPADDAKPICPDRSQFYRAAVWFLRRYPEHILLLVCSETGEPEEVGIIGDAAFSALGTALHTAISGTSAAGKKYCHLACIGRREEMTALRQDECGALLGMLLSVTSRWEPVWL